jgi:hypothetical protein
MGALSVSVFLMTLLTLTLMAGPGYAAQPLAVVRFGYLEQTGSALFLIAKAHRLFRAEGLDLVPVRFRDSASGEEALVAGRIDAGAFEVGTILDAIGNGHPLRIIAGGGVDASAGLLEELDAEREDRGIVIVAGEGPRALDKTTLVKITSALIKADLMLQNHPAKAWSTIARHRPGKQRSFRFDPNPDYWHLADLWKRHGLQAREMPRDFLANHVYEEIYCDALDRLVLGDGTDDPALQKLVSKAVCVPNCCPANTGKLFTIKGGSP